MKKVVKFTVLAVFAFITGLNVYKAQTEVQLSDAQMKNVEALASGEGEEESGKTNCFNKTTKAPNDNSLAIWAVSCGSCEGLWVTSASDASKCKK